MNDPLTSLMVGVCLLLAPDAYIQGESRKEESQFMQTGLSLLA